MILFQYICMDNSGHVSENALQLSIKNPRLTIRESKNIKNDTNM